MWVQEGCVSSHEEHKVKIIYGLKMNKTANLDTFFHSNFLHIYCICLVGTLKGEGQPTFKGGQVPSLPK